METKKEAIEIACSLCDTRFRLWVPVAIIPEMERGSAISCVKCGARITVKKGARGFTVSMAEEPVRAAAPSSPAAVAAPAAPAQDTILLIEDDRLAREMVENTIKDTGIRLIAVKNAAEALRTIRKEQINLIVSDLYLRNPADPESQMDGEELLAKVLELGLNIPSIVTTGKDIIDDLVMDPKWFDLHVKGFIQKGNPFWVEELKLKIKEVMYKDFK